jgi:adenylate cyclase
MSEKTPSAITGAAWLESMEHEIAALSGNCSLGRSSENHIVILSERVSRRHATIHAQDGQYWLIDLGSVNGTFLNGRRVRQPSQLAAGDRITIADKTYTFHELAQESVGKEVERNRVSEVTLADIRSHRCWFLLADIVGFTPLSRRLAPEELAMLVGRWVRDGRETIEKHKGSINKYLGDGYLAFWIEDEATPPQVAAAVAELNSAQRQSEPSFRFVVHCGSVMMGGSAPGEESLMGAELNYLFRIERFAASHGLGTAFSETAYEQLQPHLAFREVEGEHLLKGFDGPQRIFAQKT